MRLTSGFSLVFKQRHCCLCLCPVVYAHPLIYRVLVLIYSSSPIMLFRKYMFVSLSNLKLQTDNYLHHFTTCKVKEYSAFYLQTLTIAIILKGVYHEFRNHPENKQTRKGKNVLWFSCCSFPMLILICCAIYFLCLSFSGTETLLIAPGYE